MRHEVLRLLEPIVIRIVKKHFEEGMAMLNRLLEAEVQVHS